MLEHDPNEGISLSEDLAGLQVTLTRKRGGATLLVAILVGLMATLAALRLEVTAYAGLFVLALGVLLNQVKTTVSLQPRALLVAHTRFGLTGSREAVPYEAIRAIDLESGRLGGRRLVLRCVGRPDLVIRHGTKEDHEGLRRAIDARRPIAPVAGADELEAPAALRALRAREPS